MTVLVTGAAGFIGRAVVTALDNKGVAVRCALRRSVPDLLPVDVERVVVGEVNDSTDWSVVLKGIDCVIHLVARTHQIGESGGGNFFEYRAVNVEGMRRLAASAVSAGVRRLVFVSSVKVNGERTFARPYTAHDAPAPEDAYGISKSEAEQVLADIGERSSLETVIVRPPLVYGPGVKANFARLASCVQRGVPLPLGAVENQRSLVALPNLVDLIIHCLQAPKAAGQTFMVSDGQDVSTSALIRMMATVMQVRPRLVPVPVGILSLAGRLTGRQSEIERLTGSLQVDIRHTCETLDWRPPVSLEDGIRQALASSRRLAVR